MKEKRNYLETHQKFREELWSEFEKLVRKGTIFNYTIDIKGIDIESVQGINSKSMTQDSDGNSWFRVTELVADPNYNIHIGEDIIIGTGEITIVFGKKKRIKHVIEPDIYDLDWLCEILDSQEN